MGDNCRYDLEYILKKDLKEIVKIEFQPIYSAEENKIVSYEVFSRFYSNKIGTVSTLTAIEVLERINCIYTLDFLILEKIERHLLNKKVKICINISPGTIIREDFLEKLIVLKDGFNNLQIEITERGSFSYTDLIYKIIQLKKLGIKIIMDDFPIGSSSLENLLKTHIDSVKIDKDMIKYLESDKGKSIYKSVVKFLKELGSEITAEGVETLEELNFIKEIGVDFVQGYYTGRPISEIEFQNS